ncbi:MAG: aspartate/glutamate racemase family protein [Gammaproteobacteria bacterium]|nr:aspartate/glutamate racemase family protein [Gammaproteobacteria bacterium]
MKIAVLGTGTGERVKLPAAISELACGDIEPVLINTRVAVFAHSIADRALVDLAHVDAAIGAERDGFDAVFVNTFADYGLAAMKSALNIPVVGAGEAGLQLAGMLGERFAVITVWPKSMAHIYRDRLRDTGTVQRCAGVIHVSAEEELTRLGTDQDVMQRMHRQEATVIDRLAEACRHATEDLGADTLVLGCTCMAPVLDALRMRTTAPVVECMRAGYLATETLLRHGLTQSKLAYAAPSAASLDRLRALIDGQGAASAPGSDSGSAAECPVCLPADTAVDTPGLKIGR